MKRYWLVKTEPEVYSFDDLLRDQTTGWGGVRNYQARNFMRDAMKKGDRVLVYHSNAEPSCVVGEAEVVREGHADPTQFEQGELFDPAATPEAPRWFQVELKAVRKLKHPVTLERLKTEPSLKKMLLVQKGQRLSVQPVAPDEYRKVLELSK